MVATGNRPQLLAIVGITASGKSALAMKVAEEFNGEIISADSWTVYKGFDIGTGKPSPKDQKAVKHYLIDIRGADQGFNAPLFQAIANQAIQDIQNRAKLPILVGGTGFYIDSVLYDFGFLNNSAPEERQKLDNTDLGDLLEMAQRQKIDLTGVDQRNKRRVIRAIEAKGEKPTKKKLRPNSLIVGLWVEPHNLKKRIEGRVDDMLAAGLEQEVKHLADKFGWDAEPMKGIGYREWQAFFTGSQTLEETRQRIISATNKLAKRQRTWFKRNPDIHWFDSAEQAYAFIKTRLNT